MARARNSRPAAMPRWLNRLHIAAALAVLALVGVALFGLFADILPYRAQQGWMWPWLLVSFGLAFGGLAWVVRVTARHFGGKRRRRIGRGGIAAAVLAALLLLFALHAAWLLGLPAIAALVAGEPAEARYRVERVIGWNSRGVCNDGLVLETGVWWYDRACGLPETLLDRIEPGATIVLRGRATWRGILWDEVRLAPE